MSRDIRFLIENYYDIQKLRIETFNRIVAFTRENKDEIIKELNNFISQKYFGNHSRNASHQQFGTQDAHAKLLVNDAINLLNSQGEKRYAEFVEKYILSKKIELKIYSKIENLIWFFEKLHKLEKELYKKLDNWSYNHPLRTKFLNYVIGIGPILASGIIAWLSEPILKAGHVSQIWAYCGLAPGQERKKGEKLNYNPKLKTFCWKIARSLIMKKCFGRKLYEEFKRQAREKHPKPEIIDGKLKWTDKHIDNWARRKVVKLFLAAVWEVWRKMNNLPVTEPYPIKFLGHDTKIRPEMWMEKKKEEENNYEPGNI